MSHLKKLYNFIQPSTIRGRIRLGVLGLLLITFSLISWQTIVSIEEEFATYNQQRLLRKSNAVLANIHYELDSNKDSIDFGELIKRTSIINSIAINFYDENKQPILVLDSTYESSHNDDHDEIHPLDSLEESFICDYHVEDQHYLSSNFKLAHDDKVIGYLTIPYAILEDTLDKEIASLLERLIPVYLLLFIVIALISPLFTYRLSRSLSIISSHFRNLRVGEHYQKIEWDRSDEIGQLVVEYNRMLGELENSIRKLAKSEREMAWREMAKQVAHEIKNPLTPMKLSIQHLSKVYKDDPIKGAKMLDRVLDSIVEQINHLSKIATEFSNFAKLPKLELSKISLQELVDHVVSLFESETDVTIELIKTKNELEVYADRSQLIRVLTNLLKNAVQAKQEDKKILIKVSIRKGRDTVEINVEDNGVGITASEKAKVFSPNFTTKNSGMGIGLAMSRNIMEEMGGDIRFESKEGEGTTFYIILPLNNNLHA